MPEASLTLTADLSSVGEARRFLRRVLADWAEPAFDLGAAQVLTELATNAALHARSDYTVHLALEPAALLVEVTDASPLPPRPRGYGPDATTGRGIALVEALSTAWGVQPGPAGKTVWCRVAPDDEPTDDVHGHRAGRPAGRRSRGPALPGRAGGAGARVSARGLVQAAA